MGVMLTPTPPTPLPTPPRLPVLMMARTRRLHEMRCTDLFVEKRKTSKRNKNYRTQLDPISNHHAPGLVSSLLSYFMPHPITPRSPPA